MKPHEYWLDYLRAFACILVTVGHLLMSFQESHIIHDGWIVPTFIDLIYCFHVYIFFFCSGYLFQARSPVEYSKSHIYIYKLEKCINFLILYILFSGITYAIKTLFSGDVNSAIEHSFLEILFKHPINQMWYLYAISVVFLFAHTIKTSKSAYIIFGLSLLLKVTTNSLSLNAWISVPIKYLFENLIWFTLGQFFAYTQPKFNKIQIFALTTLFIILFAFQSISRIDNATIDTLLTLLGIVASAEFIYFITNSKQEVTGVWRYLSKYMLQIYLLHTIFAAGIRIVLFKLGISHILPHLILGLVFSFVFPVICAMVAERNKFLNFFFFPVKTLKELSTNQ